MFLKRIMFWRKSAKFLAINGGRPITTVISKATAPDTIKTPAADITGWNRDVANDDLEFGGCPGQPFLQFAAWGAHCLSTNDDSRALEWAERIWQMPLVLPQLWGDGKTPNPVFCKCKSGRFMYLFARKGWAENNNLAIKETKFSPPAADSRG